MPTVATQTWLTAEERPRAMRKAPDDMAVIYHLEYPAVLRHLLFLTSDRHLAEDLAQETFRRALEHPEQDVRNRKAWLITVASNLAYNHFRGEGRRAERESRAAQTSARSTAGDSGLEDAIDVRDALARLDARDRTALLLRHSGFSYAEIADVIGVAASSVGTTLARAQKRFRDAYEDPKALRNTKTTTP